VTDEPDLLVEQREGALYMRINRPDAMNALTLGVAEGISAGLRSAVADPKICAVVIGAVGRAFCAGADLKFVEESLQGEKEIDQIAFTQRLSGVFDEIEAAPIPVIGAVNGIALAGGLEMLLACDLILAAESARIGDGHANYGLLPGGGSSVRLPRLIGPTRAKYLLFTGELLPARELEAQGLVNAVVADEALDDAVAELVEKLAAKSPLGLARMKRLVNDGLEQPTATAIRLEHALSDAHRHSHDMEEGLAAFSAKRKPEFDGT
jgi:enoyl-CoA hydratase